MIKIKKSETADTRTCDYAKVTKDQLLASSKQHIGDVQKALLAFADTLEKAAVVHDWTKISQIDGFHADFQTGFKSTTWWDAHRRQERHHLGQPDGVRDDVNLVDVIEYICDCVMAGKARSVTVHEIKIDQEVLMKAFRNTCTQLADSVVVEE